MARRTSRMELRVDPERERRIRLAAELQGRSVSAFVLDAAAERADQVLAESPVTTVPPDFFDRLWQALGEPPEPSGALRRLAERPRRFEQR